MRQSTKIALVEDQDDGLIRLLQEQTGRPKVRRFADLYDDFADLLDFAPDVVFHHRPNTDAEDAGALRLLQRALPRVRIVLVGPTEHEVELQAMADRLDARLLLPPYDRRAVGAVLSVVDAPAGQPTPDTFLDLARGISDEVNNPLLFAAGHLQLLESMLDPEQDAEALAQVHATQRGLERIADTMERIRLLGRARTVREPRVPVRVAALLRRALETVAAGAEQPPRLAIGSDVDQIEVLGDEALVEAAMATFAGVAVELAAISETARLGAAAVQGGVRIRFEARGLALGEWQLPRAFEPYHLNRILRGTTHGLGLFLVQTVVHAHGGAAVARRRPDGTIVLDLVLPAG